MATHIRALIYTAVHALTQLGHLASLFIIFFFIFSIMGVELFGKLSKNQMNTFNLPNMNGIYH